MKIGFAAKSNKNSDVFSIYDHAVDLAAGGGEGELEFRCEENKVSHCDVIVADSLNSQRRSNFILNPEGMTIKYGICSDNIFDSYLLAREHDKRRLLKKGVHPEDVYVIGMPHLDLLFGTDEEKEAIRRIYLRSVDLDPFAKTLLFSADWGKFHETSDDVRLMSILATLIKKMNMNFIVLADEHAPVEGQLFDALRKGGAIISSNNDLVPPLLSSDVLLTSAPSTCLPFIALRRPVIVARDQEIPSTLLADTWDPTIVYDTGDLDQALQELDKLWRPSIKDARTCFGYVDGQSCERAVAAIMKVWDKKCSQK